MGAGPVGQPSPLASDLRAWIENLPTIEATPCTEKSRARGEAGR
jgi:hypothetical protein